MLGLAPRPALFRVFSSRHLYHKNRLLSPMADTAKARPVSHREDADVGAPAEKKARLHTELVTTRLDSGTSALYSNDVNRANLWCAAIRVFCTRLNVIH